MGDAAVYDLAAVVAERDALTQKLKASEAEVAQIGSYCQTLTDAKVELAAELGEAQAEVEKLRDAVSWHRCSTHGDVDPTAWGCPECVRELRAEVALRKSEVELFRDELKARCDEVAKLKAELADVEHDLSEQRKLYCAELASVRAACAAKDAAIRELDNRSNTGDSWSPVAEAALSDDASKGWIDATGAVEAIADHGCIDGSGVLVAANVPDDWAGATVKIVMTGTKAMAAIEKENDNV